MRKAVQGSIGGCVKKALAFMVSGAVALQGSLFLTTAKADAQTGGSAGTCRFVDESGATFAPASAGGAIDLTAASGDHIAVMQDRSPIQAFTYSADVNLVSGNSAALDFGISDPNHPGTDWYAANFDSSNSGQPLRVFNVNNGAAATYGAQTAGSLDFSQSLHLSLTVRADGSFTYTAANSDHVSGTLETLTGTIPNYTGGYLGISTFNAEATFSNVSLQCFQSDLGNLTSAGSVNSVTQQPDGLRVVSSGDGYLFSQMTGSDFVYSADVTFNNTGNSAASLVFRSNGKSDDSKEAYVANINPSTGAARLFRFQSTNAGSQAYDISGTVNVGAASSYHLKIVAVGSHISYFINDTLVANTGDYTITGSTYGQNGVVTSGQFGLLTWNGDVTYQNIRVTPITAANSPDLTDLQTRANGGSVEARNAFTSGQTVYFQYVSNATQSVNILPTAPDGATVTVTDAGGNPVTGAVSLPAEQAMLFTIRTTKGDASLVYRLYLFRRGPTATYYNEDYRDQYHYSVENGWANDPNGMIKIGNTYNLFYQFYGNGAQWGPMHWMHATSTDMIHWTEQPIAFYPNEEGAMFSGSAVYDANNTSGLFNGVPGGGLVTFITADGGSGQHIIAAYSSDGGNTWKQYTGKVNDNGTEMNNGEVLDWANDPLKNTAFRDPKVFRYDNKWFMVVAGGPLRIYSSDDLLNWTCESTYPGVETECPDLYRLPVKNADGTSASQYKWVLSRGGRYYEVGNFTNASGKWQFVPDSGYASTGGTTDKDGVMNFGADSYATQTFYNGAFGSNRDFTAASQPDIVSISWMNTWNDYCNQVAGATGNTRFDGTFDLALQLGLVKDRTGKVVLTQQPISGYDQLTQKRTTQTFKHVSVGAGQTNDLDGFTGDSYKMTVTFRPDGKTTEFGVDVRTGNGQKTAIRYDMATSTVSIDRSASGISPSYLFKTGVQAHTLSRNADGSLTLELYVDRASVEMFSQDYTVEGAAQIFPTPTSRGVDLYAKGGTVTAQATIQPLDSIWTNKKTPTAPQSVGLDKTAVSLYAGEMATVNAWVSPVNFPQNVIWSVTQGQNVVALTAKGSQAVITAKSNGTATLKATSVDDPSLQKTCTVTVGDFKSNLTGWTPTSTTVGKWGVSGQSYTGSVQNDNAFAFAKESASPDAKTYTYSMDVVKNDDSLVNVIFGSQSTNVWSGCYAVQLQSGGLRLFDFKNDHTFAWTGNITFPASSSAYHLDITVSGLDQAQPTISVKVNGTEYFHTLVDEKYTGGLFGFGLYNASASFRNIFLKTDAAVAQLVVPVSDRITLRRGATLSDLQTQLPAQAQAVGSDGIVQPDPVALQWDTSKVDLKRPGKYTVAARLPAGFDLGTAMLPEVGVTVIPEHRPLC